MTQNLVFALNWWSVTTDSIDTVRIPSYYKSDTVLLITGFSDTELSLINSFCNINHYQTYIYSWRDNIDPLFELTLHCSEPFRCEFHEILVLADSNNQPVIIEFLKTLRVRKYERVFFGLTISEIEETCESSNFRIIVNYNDPNTLAVSTDNKDCLFELTLKSDHSYNYT